MILNEIRDLRSSVLSRPARRHAEPMNVPDGLPSDQYAAVFARFKNEVQDHLKEMKLTRKAEILSAKSKLRDRMEVDFGPECFRRADEYYRFFDAAFSMLHE